MNRYKPFRWYFMMFCVALVVLVVLYPRSHPYGGIRHQTSKSALEQRAEEIIREQRVPEKFLVQTQMHKNDGLAWQIQAESGLESANVLSREQLPVYYWRVKFLREAHTSFLSMKSEEQDKQIQNAAIKIRGDISLDFDTYGTLIGYQRTLVDSVQLHSLSVEESYHRAVAFLCSYAPARLIVSNDTAVATQAWGARGTAKGYPDTLRYRGDWRSETKAKKTYAFTWMSYSSILKDSIEVTIRVTGENIAHYTYQMVVPDKYRDTEMNVVARILNLLLYASIMIAMLVIGFKRMRAYEIGIKTPLYFGFIVAICYAAQMYLEIEKPLEWQYVFPLVLGPLFVGGGFVLVWAVTEAVGRDIWRDKFMGIDLIAKYQFHHSEIGGSVLRGIASGLGILALWLLLTWALDQAAPLWTSVSGESALRYFDLQSPALFLIIRSVPAALYLGAAVIVFPATLFAQRYRSKWAVIVPGAVIYALVQYVNVRPLLPGITVEFLCGLGFVWLFYRTNVVTLLTALFVYYLADIGSAFFLIGLSSFVFSGWVVVGIIVCLMLLGVIAISSRDGMKYSDELAPAFVRHISERQRLQRELEIAREVQMGFLPKSEPVFDGLEIAALCKPALEVGGDYYDFIDLGKKRIGIAIGDVSGKGTQAAFYMTLTKGFLKAVAKRFESPADVLTEMNSLFYDNVERGNFISMIYAIFDLDKMTVRIARAGHNPVIRKHRDGEIEIIQSAGLALGFDKGVAFASTIRELEVPLITGDLFIFYTDGFPEAMTLAHEEFGDERLRSAVQKLADQDAKAVLTLLFDEAVHFFSKAEQHDDMTMVVVKVG